MASVLASAFSSQIRARRSSGKFAVAMETGRIFVLSDLHRPLLHAYLLFQPK
jgi:hypothetical protein